MRRVVCAALASLLVLAAAARADVLVPGATAEPLGPVPQFTLTDQDGNVVTRETLRGKVCVVSFFFSCCNTICPKVQAVMGRLQEQFAGNPDVLLVSINVYPAHDNQETLKDYARSHQVDSARWLLLRGGEKDIYDLVQKGFYQTAMANPRPSPGAEVIHTSRLMVVDHRGVIRGYVDGLENDEVERLETYVRRLVQAKYLPAINAALNGTCGVLLVIGFVLVRGRYLVAHKICMLLALLTSAIFLGCYLYYHFVVLSGQPTRFTGEGAVRVAYLAILLSHTLLAAAVAPLALTVTYLGLRNRLLRHVWLARWTLPIWLYVSITGVVVYVMLYHLYPPV